MQKEPKVIRNIYINNKFYHILEGFTINGSFVFTNFNGKYYHLKSYKMKKLNKDIANRINDMSNVCF